MRLLHNFRYFLSVAALLVATPLWAGAPAVVGITSIDDGYNLPSPAVGTPATTTITLNFNALGTSNLNADLSALSIQGANAADFTIIGGTCGAAATLGAGNPSCTVIVRYAAPTTTPEVVQLALTCSTVGAASGGFSLTCINNPPNGNSTGSISLFGSALAAFPSVPAPLLDPKILTLLSAMLLGIGIYFAARRN